MENQNLKIELQQFTGTENYYKYHNLLLTDGAYYLAQVGSCFWLMNVIYSHLLTNRNLAHEEFLVLNLKVKDCKGKVQFEDGNDLVLASQKIPYTDFALDEVKLYLVKEAFQFVVMLPSEY